MSVDKFGRIGDRTAVYTGINMANLTHFFLRRMEVILQLEL